MLVLQSIFLFNWTITLRSLVSVQLTFFRRNPIYNRKDGEIRQMLVFGSLFWIAFWRLTALKIERMTTSWTQSRNQEQFIPQNSNNSNLLSRRGQTIGEIHRRYWRTDYCVTAKTVINSWLYSHITQCHNTSSLNNWLTMNDFNAGLGNKSWHSYPHLQNL